MFYGLTRPRPPRTDGRDPGTIVELRSDNATTLFAEGSSRAAYPRRSPFEQLVNIHRMTKTHRNHLTLSPANRTKQPNVAFALRVHAGQARRLAKRGA
jgi:hypothetical protein